MRELGYPGLLLSQGAEDGGMEREGRAANEAPPLPRTDLL